MEQIKVLLVEDRDVIRDSLKFLFRNSEEIKIIAEAEDGLKALYFAKNIAYDVILMDYCMPEMNGHDALKQIMEINPTAKIIMFSFLNNPFEIRELLEMGAYGYILKDSSLEVYENAIKTVSRGGKYICNQTTLILSSNNKTA